MKFGYTRISTIDQVADRQTAALESAGIDRIFHDTASGGKRKRPQLELLLQQLREDDQVIVHSLDRLSRSLIDLLEIAEKIDHAGAHLVSLRENIDSSSSSGRLVFHVFGVIAEFERERIRERVREGIDLARAKGHVGGRPQVLTEEQRRAVVAARLQQNKSISECSRIFGVSRRTVSRIVAAREGG